VFFIPIKLDNLSFSDEKLLLPFKLLALITFSLEGYIRIMEVPIGVPTKQHLLDETKMGFRVLKSPTKKQKHSNKIK
jgi:hypothetical protein